MKYSVGISGQRKHTIDRLGIIRKFNQKLFFPDGRQQQRHDRRRIVFQRVVAAADTPVVHETALGDRVELGNLVCRDIAADLPALLDEINAAQ